MYSLSLSMMAVMVFLLAGNFTWLKFTAWLLVLGGSAMNCVPLMMEFPSYGVSLWLSKISAAFYILCVLCYGLVFVSLVSINSKVLFRSYLILFFISSLFFMANSSLLFYIIFELSVLPIFYIVMVSGYQPERLPAAYSLFIYTLSGSMPFLMGVVGFWTVFGVNSLSKFSMSGESFSLLVTGSFLLCFMIKLPVYLLHSWLPKAHVEAPVGGSMVLAAILLKLGGYGILVFLLLVSPQVKMLLMAWGLAGTLMPAWIALRLSDMKSVIAYSSVSHMSMALAGVSMLSEYGISGAVLMFISHAFSSSGLFFWAYTLYLSVKSRSVLISKGVLSVSAGGSICWFIILTMSLGVPPSLNFGSEVVLVSSLCSSLSYLGVGLFMASLLPAAAYTLMIFSLIQQSEKDVSKAKFNAATSWYVVLWSHILMNVALVGLMFLYWKHYF